MQIMSTSIDNDDRVYRGIVEDNNDPQKTGRVKVRIISIHGENGKGIPTEHLPWADVVQYGASANAGSFIVPEIGTMVLVLFENGNHTSPLVIGTIYQTNRKENRDFKTSNIANQNSNGRVASAKQNDVPTDGQGDIASRIIYQSPKGTSITIYDQDDSEAIELKDANGQILRLTSPLTQDATQNNQHTVNGDADKNLVNVSTILLKNPFGQMLQIVSNGKQGIISLLDEPNMQGLEINSALGYARIFNKKGKSPEQKGGVEVYVSKDYAALRTEQSEFLAMGDTLSLSAPKVNITSPSTVISANNLGLKASNITLSGSIHLDGQTVSNSTIKAHFIHGTGSASSPSNSGANTMLKDETSLVGYVNPKDKLDKKTDKVLTSTKATLETAKGFIDTMYNMTDAIRSTVQTLSENAPINIGNILPDITMGNVEDLNALMDTLTKLGNGNLTSIEGVKDILNVIGTEYTLQSDGRTYKIRNTANNHTTFADRQVVEWMEKLSHVDSMNISKIAESLYQGYSAANSINQQLKSFGDVTKMQQSFSTVRTLADAMKMMANPGLVDSVTRIESIYNQIVMVKTLIDRSVNDIKTIQAPTLANKETKKGSQNRVLLQAKSNADLALKSIDIINDMFTQLGNEINNNQIKQVCKAMSFLSKNIKAGLDLASVDIEGIAGAVKDSLELLTSLSKWGKV